MAAGRSALPETAMPIDPEYLQHYIQRRGHRLHHVTSRAAAPSIEEQGLVPGSQLGHRLHGGFFATRADHVYLCDLLSIPVIKVRGERALFMVDLTMLDPDLMDPDEDSVQQSYWSPGGPWLPPEVTAPPERKTDESQVEISGQDGALAAWADEAPGFDAPEITAKALDQGRLSYRGVIPPEALEEIHHPSEASEFFGIAARAALGDGLRLPVSPPLGYYTTEVERAYRLAAYTIDFTRSLAAPGTAEQRTRFELPEDALDVETQLRDLARERRRANDYGPAGLLAAAAEVAEAVSAFEPECGWSAAKEQCIEVGTRCAECVKLIAKEHNHEEAARLATSGMLTVAAVAD